MIIGSAAFGLPACDRTPFAGAPDWPVVDPAPITAMGVGRDPGMTEPVRPWPLTLGPDDHRKLARLTDIILPADGLAPSASTAGIPLFIDEWISAPYPEQHRDRLLITAGLLWIDTQAQREHHRDWLALSLREADAIAGTLSMPAKPGAGLKPAEFFHRLRYLTIGGYYSAAAGLVDLGYVGNEAIGGDWPGPTPAALDHLEKALGALGLA